MNYTKTQSSNKFAKAVAILGASTLLSCSAVVLLFSQSAMSGQLTSDSEQLLAQRGGSGSGGSDGPNEANPSTGGVAEPLELSPRPSDDPTDPVNRQEGSVNGDVEDRLRLSPRLSDDPNAPVNRQEGASVNDSPAGAEGRYERSPQLEDNMGDRDARRDGPSTTNDGSMMNNGGSTIDNGSAQQRYQRYENNTTTTPGTTPRGGTSNTTPSYNQNTQPSYNQNSGASSSAPVRGLW